MLLISILIPDTPEEVTIQEKRMKFIEQKVVDGLPDEDYDYAQSSSKSSNELESLLEEEENKHNRKPWWQRKGLCCGHAPEYIKYMFRPARGENSRMKKIPTDLPNFPMLDFPSYELPRNLWPVPLVKGDNTYSKVQTG